MTTTRAVPSAARRGATTRFSWQGVRLPALPRPRMSDWTIVVPVLAVLLLVTWNRELPGVLVAVVALLLAGAVLAAVASLALYGLFVMVQTGRHRDYFLPVTSDGSVPDSDGDGHADPPSTRTAVTSLVLLVVALVAVVGDAKTVSPTIEAGVAAANLPQSFVGVVIALLVLLPETLAAARAARRDRVQISLNLALGSAMASIGLTIPAIALASIWLDGPLLLGLGGT